MIESLSLPSIDDVSDGRCFRLVAMTRREARVDVYDGVSVDEFLFSALRAGYGTAVACGITCRSEIARAMRMRRCDWTSQHPMASTAVCVQPGSSCQQRQHGHHAASSSSCTQYKFDELKSEPLFCTEPPGYY